MKTEANVQIISKCRKLFLKEVTKILVSANRLYEILTQYFSLQKPVTKVCYQFSV